MGLPCTVSVTDSDFNWKS